MSQSEEHKANEAKTVVKMLMKLSGVDIIMPEPKREELIKELGLEENIEFHRAMGEISMTSPKTQENIIKALVISFLSNSQLLDLADSIKGMSMMITEYCQEHTEYTQRPSAEDFAKDFLK